MEIYRPKDAFGINIWVLTFFGAWPSSVKHPFLRSIYKLYGFALQIIYVTVLLPPQFINFYFVRSDLENVIGSSWFLLTCLAYVTKILLIIFRGKKIEEFFKRLKQPMFAPKSKKHLFVLKKYTTIAKASSFTFITMSLITVMLWLISPFVDKSENKQLLHPAWYPYNTSVNPAYAYTYAFQAFFLVNTASMNSMIDTMITNFYVVMVGQIEILKMDFKQLTSTIVANSLSDRSGEFSKKTLISENILFFEEEDGISKQTPFSNSGDTISTVECCRGRNTFYEEESLEHFLNKRVIKCAEHYKEILKFVKDITNVFEFGIVCQVCASCIVICTSTYELTMASPKTLQFYVVLQFQMCMLVQIFLYTWRGNDFTVKTTELKDAVYECGWTSVPNTKFRKSLCIIMAPLQIPVKLIVGKFFILSVDTFFKIIKLAYTVYVLLKQINDRKH